MLTHWSKAFANAVRPASMTLRGNRFPPLSTRILRLANGTHLQFALDELEI